MQLTTREGADAEAMHRFLMSEGYIVSTESHADLLRPGVVKVRQVCDLKQGTDYMQTDTYGKPEKRPRQGTTVDLSHALISPLSAVLAAVTMTVQACFISWNKPYCRFPVRTMLTHQAFLLTPLTAKTPTLEEAQEHVFLNPAVVKYAKRNGYKVKSGL